VSQLAQAVTWYAIHWMCIWTARRTTMRGQRPCSCWFNDQSQPLHLFTHIVQRLWCYNLMALCKSVWIKKNCACEWQKFL